MPSDHIPKRPAGHVPGKEFTSGGDPYGMKVGLITRVDEINMKADVKILTGGGNRAEVDLTQPMYGPRSFWGGVPEVNSIVIIGYRRKHKQLYEAMILGYLPVSKRLGIRFDPFAPDDPGKVAAGDQELFSQIFGNASRVKRLRMRPGDVGGMSSSGAELVLSKDIRMYNRAGDFFELRDSDRTWIGQSIHKVESQGGVRHLAGPVRRGAFFTYPDVLSSDGITLKSTTDRYFGRTVYQAAGPGSAGSANRYADSNGKLLDVFNNTTEFPPITYSNGRRVFIPSTQPAVSIEDADNGVGSLAFTEDRIQVSHTSDLSQEVLEEIDGFEIDRRRPYIERTMGTLVGNDSSSSTGERQYGRVLKPKIFDDFVAKGSGKFSLEEVPRDPMDDKEVYTTAGAYMLRINPPRSIDDNSFAFSVSKQGKVFLNVPGSQFERYPSGSKNVSVEAMLQGALKAYIGASGPSNTSINLTCAGGIVADIGSNSDGRAIDVTYHSSYRAQYQGTPDTDDIAFGEDVQGVKQSYTSGDSIENVAGAKLVTVNGAHSVQCDSSLINCNSGFSASCQEFSLTAAGKSQYTYALVVMESIVAGGKISTILAGGSIQNVAVGAYAINVLSGATSIVSAAGAYSVTVGAGGLTMTCAAGAVAMSAAAGAMSFAAAAGAIAITAGLALTVTSPLVISLVAVQILIGGPPAVLGVARGLPMMPPGTPSLDWITGLPLQGCALVRSL